MKFQKMIRMQVMLVGLGAALILGTSAYAQQEVSPATFDVNPGTPQAVSSTAQVAQSPAPAAMAKSEPAVSVWSAQNTKQVGDSINTMLATIMIIGVGAIALYVKAATQRGRRQVSPQNATGAAAR